MRRFIYLDTETLNSYLAQIYDGLVQTEEIESQTGNSSSIQKNIGINSAAEADLKIFDKGLDGKIEFAYDRLRNTSNTDLIKDVQTKMLHDNAFNHLMLYLEGNNGFGDGNIGDFTKICDDFYIVDFDYYKDLFNKTKVMSTIKKSEEDQIREKLKLLQENEEQGEGANANEIHKKYYDLSKNMINESNKKLDEIKNMIDLLHDLIPYRRIVCVGDNMVVLNDKFMRDDIAMTSFKFGGKINVLGYITNKISDSANENLSAFAQIATGINKFMIPFFGSDKGLNIVHPIAIYYE